MSSYEPIFVFIEIYVKLIFFSITTLLQNCKIHLFAKMPIELRSIMILLFVLWSQLNHNDFVEEAEAHLNICDLCQVHAI